MGITKKPSYRDYWSAKLQMRDPFILSSMSLDWFCWLLSNMPVNDNSVRLKKAKQGFARDKLRRPPVLSPGEEKQIVGDLNVAANFRFPFTQETGMQTPSQIDGYLKVINIGYVRISGDEQLLPAYGVYKSKYVYPNWVEGDAPGTRYNRLMSGWFNSDFFEDWFEN
ncbi:hypothetical protein CBL_21513 [Carabus blaptoides fortunei]